MAKNLSLSKADLIHSVATDAGLSKKDAAAAVDAFLSSISNTLAKGGKVQLTGFGSFETRKRAARMGLNPQTKATIKIPATKVPAFKAGKALKDAVK